MQQILI